MRVATLFTVPKALRGLFERERRLLGLLSRCAYESVRLLRRILEVDPLLCPRCGVRLQVISVITEPRVVDRILAHVREGRCVLRSRGGAAARVG